MNNMANKKCKQCRGMFDRIISFIRGICPNCYVDNAAFNSEYNDFDSEGYPI